MKRFVIALTLLVFIAVGSFFVTSSAKKAIEETKDALLSCAIKEENISTNVVEIKTALNTWDKNKKILYVFMFHDDFSETEKNMIKLRYLTEFPEPGEIKRLSRESAMMLDNLADAFCVSFENIF